MVQPASKPAKTHGALVAVSLGLGNLRWLFLPLGLFALLAVGIHVAADTVCDRLLWVADRCTEAWDHAMATFDLTSPLVGAISFSARTRLARGIALLWELAADLVVALPALGYHENQRPLGLRDPDGWKSLLERMVTRPTTLRIFRPVETLAFALAGACAVAKMVQAELYLDLRGLFGDGGASPVARFSALLALGAVGAALGIRAVQRALQHADARSELDARTRATRFTVGLIGSMLVLPLAVAAIVDGAPLLGFFR